MEKRFWIVIWGEAYAPKCFDTEAEAQFFANEDPDYVSGPWLIEVEV